MFGLLLAFAVEAGWTLWLRFPAWVQFFVSGVTWSVRAPSGNLCCVTSPGKLYSAVVEFVALRHWHGPRLHKWLVFKVRVQRTGACWRAQLRGVSEMFKPCSRESRESEERAFCDWRVVSNSPTWPCPRAACRIRLSVWGGAPPMSRLSGGGIYVVRHSSHSVEDTTYRFYMPV